MSFNGEILFFFSALGAFNGVVLSGYIFLTAGKKHIANIFLAIALFMLSVRAGKSVFFYFNDNLAETFVQIGIIAYFLTGPFLYFFVSTVSHPQNKPPNWKIHLLILIPAILIPTFVYPYYEYRHLWSPYLLTLVSIQWFVYIALSLLQLDSAFKRAHEHKSRISPTIKWTIHVVIGFGLVWLAYFTSGYTSYIVGALTFTVISYLLILFILNTNRRKAFLLNASKTTLRNGDSTKDKAILTELETLLSTEPIHSQSSLKCADVAKLLGVPTYQLSQAINGATGMNFTSFINQYRIEAAKKMLRSRPELTAEAIGQECGFKSKSSFYAAFKKITGTTPSKFV